jgi:serine/threonine protein kinase
MLEVIDNKYKLIRTLGQGGNGTVYVAWNEQLQKEVAVKVLTEASPDGSDVKRFQREARALSACNHPSIVQVSAFGVTQDNRLYYAMDYIQGRSLATEIAEHGQLTPKRFAALFTQVLSALEHAHSLGLIHRDIKPSNIMLTADGGIEKPEHAVLIDFGLTRAIGQNVKLTATNSLVGTPYYMSPEQCLNKRIDERSDLYSLGCTMLEAATGKPPFSGEAIEVMMAQLHQSPDTVPAELVPLLRRLLAKEPAERFESAKAARECLEELHLEQYNQFSTGKHSVNAQSAAHQALKTSPSAFKQAVPFVAAFLICGALAVCAFIFVRNESVKTAAQSTAPPPAVRWKQTEQKAQQLQKQNHELAAETFREAIAQLETEDPSSKYEELNLIRQLLDVSSYQFLPPSVWEDAGKKGIRIAHDRKLTKTERDFYILIGKLYAGQKDVQKAEHAYECACEVSRQLPLNDNDKNNAEFTFSSYARWLGDSDNSVKYSRAAIRTLMQQEKDAEFREAVATIPVEERTFQLVRYTEAHQDLSFARDTVEALKLPVKDQIRYCRRLVWRAWLENELGDIASARRDLNDAYRLADKVATKPKNLAAWTLHEQLGMPWLTPEQRISMAKQALEICTDPSPPPDIYTEDAICTCYEQLAIAYELAGQFQSAYDSRMHAAKLASKRTETFSSTQMEPHFSTQARCVFDLNKAVYDAVKAKDLANVNSARDAASSSLAAMRAQFRIPTWRAYADHFEAELKRAQEGIDPSL